MTDPAAADPSVTEFESTVASVDGDRIVLAETYFYPEGGGQPADRGVLDGIEVVDVQSVDGDVVHTLAEQPAVEAGETVTGAVDPDFRRYCMRAHTAGHALYGAARRLYDDLDYGGFDISPEKIRLDLRTGGAVDDDALVELERLVNRAVWESREVSWVEIPREEALDDEHIAVTTTDAVAEQREVRVVTIDDWDRAVCGGTHVSNTREVGPVTVLDRSNPGEGLTRVEFAVGPTAIDRRAAESRAVRGASTALDASPTGVDEAARRLREERDELESQVQALREQVIETQLSDLREATVTRDGHEWLAGSIATTDPNALSEFADRLESEAADVVALVGANGEYVAVATAGDVDAAAVVDEVTAEFGGGGGGSPTAAQAGGLDADPDDVVAFLRD